MAKKRFKVDVLSMSSINNLKKQLLDYKASLQRKTDEFVRRLAEVGIPVIDGKMQEASFQMDSNNVVSGSNTKHLTYVKVDSFGNYSRAVLTVEGQDLLFIEFGSGVHYNGAAGSSPNPKGQELGYTIGSYGDGHGKEDKWWYTDETGVSVLTYGTKATMPVYTASLEIRNKVNKIAKEVFSK